MAFENWSPEENDRIVADYFAMLAQDSAQQPSIGAGCARG